MSEIAEHQQSIPNAHEFAAMRQIWRDALFDDASLRQSALRLQEEAAKINYTYQFEWLGVPIIRLPDDIVLYQEIINDLKPSLIIETGVARGGSLILSASMMDIVGVSPAILGLDLQILDHTKDAIKNSKYSDAIAMWEGDSASTEAKDWVNSQAQSHVGPQLLVLDSDHTHQHVYRELNLLAPQLPVGSLIMVADTLIEELPENHYSDREWGHGNNPYSAVQQFLAENKNDYVMANQWSRRALQSEFRDGIIRKIS